MLGFSEIEISDKVLVKALQEYIEARWYPKDGDARSVVRSVTQKASYDSSKFVVKFDDDAKKDLGE